jgi:hypothetical protein
MIHGQIVCQCGRRLGGCRCPDHKDTILKTYPGCIVCKPDKRPLKERLEVHEKKNG